MEKNIVLDINSGAVHVVEDIVYDILDYYKTYTLDEIIKLLEDKYDDKDIMEAYEEISLLENEGILYSEGVSIEDIRYNEDNIIKALCLHVAHDCNLRCNYCFASQGDFKGDRSLMSLEVGKKSFRVFGKTFRGVEEI